MQYVLANFLGPFSILQCSLVQLFGSVQIIVFSWPIEAENGEFWITDMSFKKLVHSPSSCSYLGFCIRVSSDALCNTFSHPKILLLIAGSSRSMKYAGGQFGKFWHRYISIVSQHIKSSERFGFTCFFNLIFTPQGLFGMQCEKTLRGYT